MIEWIAIGLWFVVLLVIDTRLTRMINANRKWMKAMALEIAQLKKDRREHSKALTTQGAAITYVTNLYLQEIRRHDPPG